jgi:hypothetical protein
LRKPLVRKPLLLYMAMDVAEDVATDTDVLPRQHRLQGVSGAQTRQPKPHNNTQGRQRKEMTRMRNSMKRSWWKKRRSSSRHHHHHHHCLTLLRLWLLRLSGCSA